MIEINIQDLEKSENKKVWVKDSSKKGGGYWANRKTGKKEKLLKTFNDKSDTIKFKDFNEFEKKLEGKLPHDDVPEFEPTIVTIAGEKWYVSVEAWFDGCLEYRGFPETNKKFVSLHSKNIMVKESKMKNADIFKYFPNSKFNNYNNKDKQKEFGINFYGMTYIAKKV